MFHCIANDPTDPAVYDMICAADTIGVFQIESRAQMTMLPRLRPRVFYDLVIEVAIVRPGPIQGKMVHPYLRRREGLEAVEFPSEDVREVLERTLGVPLFQEQAMQLAIVAAGFTPGEADQLRRAMAAWKRKGDKIAQFGVKLIDGMLERGYPREFAERCFEQIRGFSEYGFPESHAASFALIVYVSSWLKKHEPAAFAAALINSQPMGFYAPAQIVQDAQRHGVEVRAIDVNRSAWDGTLERGADGRDALRLGMRLVKGLREEEANRIAEAVAREGAQGSVEDLWRVSGASVQALKCLARGDAFGSMGLDRQGALWRIRPLRNERLPLFETLAAPARDGEEALPRQAAQRETLLDYNTTGLSLKSHPVAHLRSELDRRGVVRAEELKDATRCPTGRILSVAGVALVRQRPGTASGVVFITLEDETGMANLVVWPRVFERYRRAARQSVAILAHGKVERQGEVVHVHADRLITLDDMLPSLVSRSRDFH
ncbi:MAG: OB-fold nucleic acid binding domain-containing protein [Planctomycetota bacterium]|nr:OB-fold nucleic acid binding domain-containing protein [Planctomycetota bacterium]